MASDRICGYDTEDREDFIEVPSCIESLTSSAGQLRQLAYQATHYYGKIIMCYGYTSEPKSNPFNQVRDATVTQTRICCKSAQHVKSGKQIQPSISKQHDRHKSNLNELKRAINEKGKLESIDSVVSILPCLTEICAFVERCFVTIEATIKRITYYLNLASQHDKKPPIIKYETFQLTPDVRLDAIFISLMDLMFALINLEKTLCDHTSIRDNLNLLDAICRQLVNYNGSDDILSEEGFGEPLERGGVTRLSEYVGSIKLALGIESPTSTSIFRLCIDHLQHLNLILSKDKTQAGFKYFSRLFEEFLVFYADHLIDVTAQNKETDLNNKNNPRAARTVAAILIDTNLTPSLYMNTQSRKILGLLSLSILHSTIFNKTDKRVNKAINQAIQRTKPSNIVLLEGSHCHILLDEFLQSHAPKACIEKKSYDQFAEELPLLLKLDANLEFERLSLKSSAWLSKLKSEVAARSHDPLNTGWSRKQILILDQGLKLLEEINSTIGNIFVANQHQNVTITKTTLIAFYRLLALVKSLKTSIEDNLEALMISPLLKLEHFIREQLSEFIESMQKRQIMMNYTDRRLELIWTMKLASIVSKSKMMSNPLGRITLSICLPMLMTVFDQEELRDLNLLMDLLRLNIYDRIVSLTDCSLLYWHITSLGTFYINAFEELDGASSELNALHLALDDIRNLFDISEKPGWSQADISWLMNKRDIYLESLEDELVDQFKGDYLDKVCQELEVELRLQVHRDLYTDDHINPFRRHMYDFREILGDDDDCLPVAFRIMRHRFNLKRYVEHHLNEVCYNLTAIAPHDWFTYNNMMNLARHKYGLKFVETQLPAQTLDSGLDLLDIIRNLSLFASRYSYDLTNQLFLEKCSNRLSTGSSFLAASIGSSYALSSSNQSLNVLQIEHVAQSIQTHGYGILDSTVNCTYQTLKKLINVFSRQLSDEKLRAVLQKEYQHMINEFKAKQASHWVISFDKANRMARKFKLSIASLTESLSMGGGGGGGGSNHHLQQNGVTPQQQRSSIDLDSIRQTVTQLGNLLAFIRLIKSGALSSASKAVEYVPDLSDLAELRSSACAEEEFHDYETYDSLLDAAKNFDQCLIDLEDNFLPKTNYSKIIVNLFTNLLSTSAGGQPEPAHGNQDDPGGQDKKAQDLHEVPEQASPGIRAAGKQTHHLDLFFLLVPALTINYIDYLINCKERVASRSSMGRFGALLSDDGFAIGIAFLLTVLNQTGDYNKLVWLTQTCTKLREDIEQVETLLRDTKYEESLKQTSSMTLRRLTRLHSEYVALDDTLNCALLLFENLAH